MLKKFSLKRIFLFLLVMFSFQTVWGQVDDRCSDILRNGTMQYLKSSTSSYFKQIVYSRFLSYSYDEFEKGAAGEFTIPIKKIILGAKYSQNEYNLKQREVEKIQHLNTVRQKEVDVANAIGDSNITGTWLACIKNRGGLALSITPYSNTQAVMKVVWVGYPGSPTTIIKNFEFVVSNNDKADIKPSIKPDDCFKEGESLDNLIECRVTITLPDENTTLLAKVNTNIASAEAFLPPRWKIEPVSIRKRGRIKRTEAYRQQKNPRGEILLSPRETEEGWFFDPSSAVVPSRPNIDESPSNWNTCDRVWSKATDNIFEFGFRMQGQTHGPGRHHRIYCSLNVSINKMRYEIKPLYVVRRPSNTTNTK